MHLATKSNCPSRPVLRPTRLQPRRLRSRERATNGVHDVYARLIHTNITRLKVFLDIVRPVT
jgi:hypothetical protein